MAIPDAYQELHEARLRELDADIQQLEAKAMRAKASAKILYYEELQTIYRKRDAAEGKLEELKKVGGESWHELKHGLDAAWNELRDGVKEAAARSQEPLSAEPKGAGRFSPEFEGSSSGQCSSWEFGCWCHWNWS